MAWLNALEALLAVEGTLPVNVMILLEGDEILGSPNYHEMFARYRDRLATADASLSPGASQDGSGKVAMNLGYKGMIYADLVSSGASWGKGPQGKGSPGRPAPRHDQVGGGQSCVEAGPRSGDPHRARRQPGGR